MKAQRVSYAVLHSMRREACPALRTADEKSSDLTKRLKQLKHALDRGRHRCVLSERFDLGILSVVLAHPAFGLPNMTKVEEVHNQAFNVFLDALEVQSGGFLR